VLTNGMLVGYLIARFLCCVCFCLSSFCVLCAQCFLCLLIVHSRLPLRFSLTFICLVLVCPMFPLSLDCPFQIAPSVFSDVYMPNYQSTLNPFRVCYFNLWCETDKLDILRVC
jgi:hypothetical protein